MSGPSIKLTFTLKRSTWEYLQTHLEDAAKLCAVSEHEKNIEVHNVANTVRSALQTDAPPIDPVADWLSL